MSSSTPQKTAPKMCKSPKNSNFPLKSEKVHIINEYENLNTNCTVIGSNNLHLVKKPQMVTNLSPVYSNPSPGYPPSPYSSPASLKSPSPQSFKPPTPQPSFPVMQIIHSSHQLLARPLQAAAQNTIKLKPHLNILPKPSASPQPPKPSVSPHIVIPSQQTATIMPTAQPLLLNQMPMLAPGVQLILRPQTAKMPTHVQTAAPQGLILQPSGQPLLQIQSQRTAQPMVRVLTNGMHLAPQTQVVTQVASPVITQQTQIMQQNEHLSFTQAHITSNSPLKKKPKKKKQKLDLANIMKLSGIGDEDDIQFESDTSQSETEPTIQITENIIRPQHLDNKRIGNIQIASVPQPTVSTGTPLVQLLNQSFQSGVNSASFQASPAATVGMPLNSFIAPNITINNGLVVQRNGGFKLALGEDGRLVLQHDPTLNQDLQSQLLLQSIFGLNGLVLQPSIDQQVHSQTVQTIQQQSVQTIQQQTVQSQTIQTVQQQTVQPHMQTIQQAIQPQIQAVQPQTVQQTVQQTIQHQTVQSQPLTHAHTQPMQIVQPQPIHTIQSHNIQQHTIQSQPTVQAIQSQVQQSIHSQIQSLLQSQPLQTIQPQPVHTQAPAPTIQTQTTQPILKVQPFQKTQPPVQTVHPQPVQTIHHHPPPQHNMNENQQNHPPQTSYVVNLTPEQLELLKRNGQLTVNGQTIFMQRPNTANKTPEIVHQNHENKVVKLSPKIKPVVKKVKSPAVKTLQENLGIKNVNHVSDKLNNVKESPKSSLVMALQSPPKITPTQQKLVTQPPSATVQPTVQATVSSQTQTPKLPVQAKVQGTQTTQTHTVQTEGTNHEVDHILGQLLDESGGSGSTASVSTSTSTTNQNQQQQQQRIHTIQLTPQQQQHLKSIQLQIQTLSARLTPTDTEMHNALKLLFTEQQKILASGKLLPPDKVIYQNNQLTIINPSSLGIGNGTPVKSEPQVLQAPVQHRPSCNEPNNNNQPNISTAQSIPKVTANVSTEGGTTVSTPLPPVPKPPIISIPTPVPPQVQQNKFIPSFTKAQLLEQQLNTDQNGAIKPDVHTPFRDKADACKRLIRYHCYNQPVLSQKDLNKADEIFELTARHFIDKFSRMVDKYRFLLVKESMRQVQTSELMMLDRMFLAEEQQSLMRLRHELQECPSVEMAPSVSSQAASSSTEHGQEEYDEWACIQRELGCLQPASIEEMRQQQQQRIANQSQLQQNASQTKRSASSDSRLETLKKFRVDKHSKRHSDTLSGQSNFVGSNCTNNAQQNHFTVNSGKTQNIQQKNLLLSSSTSTCNAQNVRPQLNYGNRALQYANVGGVYHSTNILPQQYTQQQFTHMQDVQNMYGAHAQQLSVPPYNNTNCSSVHNSVNNIKNNVQSHGSQSSEGESGNNSIDEHVQSAIDSILNLQQNSNLDLDEAVSSILS
ncbi:hypothetical protein RI129_012446 [Pyrocoelia pectoralis]|uniref:GLTSCR protein conserved domain-containing protein n=1 Tax=Pyrocoelia pectoralis TaxID=417401 RepID=A0AAN7ZEX3_9COLE